MSLKQYKNMYRIEREEQNYALDIIYTEETYYGASELVFCKNKNEPIDKKNQIELCKV